MRESVYQEASASAPTGSACRYQDVDLERVDGVWPPHRDYARRRLRTIEDRVDLVQGQSYFMSPDMIHDVEVDRAPSADRPWDHLLPVLRDHPGPELLHGAVDGRVRSRPP